MRICAINVSSIGNKIADILNKQLQVEIYSKSTIENFDIKAITKEVMQKYDAVIFICSTGIAVRMIAPYLKNKVVDPAVLVIDTSAKFVISLLSGHLGGANELTLKVSSLLQCQPVITTATDNLGITAPDIIAKNNNLIIEDMKTAKNIAAKLVEGKKIGFLDEKNEIKLPKGYVKSQNAIEGCVIVTNKLRCKLNDKLEKGNVLKLIRKDIVIGIGCRKNYDSSVMKQTVIKVLENYNLDVRAVSAISTVEIKKNEPAILKLHKFLDCGFKIWDKESIKEIQHRYKGSDFVEKTIGVRAVCEPCVELMGAQLLTDKIACNGMTICIGQLKKD